MPITAKDIVIYESARLTDEDNGGGLPTGKKVVDGQVNNLFPDTSRLDRTQGRVNIRKVFCGVAVDTQEGYQGSHFMVSKDAADSHVNMIAFAGTATDIRATVKNDIESYLVPGVSARMYLLGDQYKGQRMILAFQELSAPEPELGGTLLLRGEDPDTKATYEQYIKVAEYEAHEQTFTYEHNGEFKTLVRRVCTIKITARLTATFYGGTPWPTGAKPAGSAKVADILSTTVADAARYYGVTALARRAMPGDLQVRVNSVYKPIVPSAYSENLLTDRAAAADLAIMQPAGPAISRPLQFALVAGSQSRSYLERVPQRGSLQLSLDGGIFKCDGSGTLRHQSGNNNFSRVEVNFETGQIDAWRNAGNFSGSANATYTPAVRILGNLISVSREVTPATRTFNWTFDLSAAVPMPGSLRVAYRALGKWQQLDDSGSGQLVGQGSGTINFVTGSLAITTAALPDADSEIIVQFQPSQALEVELLLGTKAVGKNQRLELPDGILPGSLRITWVNGGTNYALNSDSQGMLTGSGSGVVRDVDGLIEFTPSVMPGDGLYQMSYTKDIRLMGEAVIPGAGNQSASGSVGKAFKPRSFLLRYAVRRFNYAGRYNAQGAGNYTTHNVDIRDDGAGNLKRGNENVGVIDYQTGVFSFTWSQGYSYKYEYYVGQNWTTGTVNLFEEMVGPGSWQALETGPGATPISKQVNAPELDFSLGKPNILTGSLWFIDGGNHYIERDGILWKNPDSRTGAGSRVGRVDLGAGRVIVSDMNDFTGNINLLACARVITAGFAAELTFRTPGSPLKQANFQLAAVAYDGTLINASADAAGHLVGDGVTGSVNTNTGVVKATFNKPIMASSARYNTVLLTALPLDATRIGLDPVRLPADGKVPIYQDGDVLVLSHTASQAVGSPAGGAVLDAGRDYVADLYLVGANGKRLAPSQYTEDRDGGTLTLKAGYSLVDEAGTTVTTPLTFVNRIEHMSLVQDVQISGDLTLADPLVHEYPAGETTVSSCLQFGDRFASWGSNFVQQSWNSASPNWQDEPSGGAISANYNWADHPVQVTNRGAVDEKWALVFTSQTTYNLLSQTRGLIASGNLTTDLAPLNPNTGTPYFVLEAAGFSSGWATGNVVRFNTSSALAPVWLLRCVSVGRATHPDDRFEVTQRGDAD